MLNKFTTYYQSKNLFNQTGKILLTVSGGMDSIFMVQLFLQSGLNIGIAHCNFKLRGADADQDEQFVKDLAEQHQIPFYTISFDTQEYANNNGISIQMAARDLRYSWFNKIRVENNYEYIATAHHKNDVAETMLINLTKGTGLAGLHGIQNKNNNIIRPLLCFTREEIERFTTENNVAYREDKSNADTKYVRNKIRHKVIPELELINPALIETLYTESEQFLELEEIVNQKIEEVKKHCFFYDGELIKIEIEKLKEYSPLKTYLYYLIKDYGFNIAIIEDLINGLDEQSGKFYYSEKYQILKDREYLILASKQLAEKKEYQVNSISDFNSLPLDLKVEIQEVETISISKSSSLAYLDADKMEFPLMLRKWKKGDSFQPFGMKGNKKLSDFFIDEKLSLLEKENTWILVTNQQIVWVIGMRIDDRFKLSSKTKNVMLIELL